MWRCFITAALWSFLVCIYSLSALLKANPNTANLPVAARSIRRERQVPNIESWPLPPAPQPANTVNSSSICSGLTSLPNGQEWSTFERSLDTYKQLHSDHLSCTHCRTLVWSCGSQCSGLGDQLHQVTMVLVLAIVSERVLFLHWDNRITMMKHLRPGKIDWSALPRDVLEDQSEDTSLVEAILSSTAHVTTLTGTIDVPFWRSYTEFRKLEVLEEGFKRIGLSEILKTEKDRNQLPYVMGVLLRFLFNFSSEVFSQLEQTQSTLGLFNGRYVAVHLRTGFLGSIEEEIGRFSPLKVMRSRDLWEATLNCSLQLTDEEYGANSNVLLATDSELVRQWAAEVYRGRVRMATHSLTHFAHSWYSDDLGGWVDWLLLARAGHMIRGVSEFAVSAGALCSLPQTRQCSLNCKCRPHYLYHTQNLDLENV